MGIYNKKFAFKYTKTTKQTSKCNVQRANILGNIIMISMRQLITTVIL